YAEPAAARPDRGAASLVVASIGARRRGPGVGVMSGYAAADVQTLIAVVAPRLASLRATLPVPLAGGVPEAGSREQATLLRRALQEWGVECRHAGGLAALEAFGIVSARGTEITVAGDLPAAELALAYARCLVRLALERGRAFATWFHYRAGCVPAHVTAEERRA